MATAKKNTALALVDSFQVVGRYEDRKSVV